MLRIRGPQRRHGYGRTHLAPMGSYVVLVAIAIIIGFPVLAPYVWLSEWRRATFVREVLRAGGILEPFRAPSSLSWYRGQSPFLSVVSVVDKDTGQNSIPLVRCGQNHARSCPLVRTLSLSRKGTTADRVRTGQDTRGKAWRRI